MVCLLCYSDIDSHDHLFFKCPYSSQLWNRVLQKTKMSDTCTSWGGVIEGFAGCYNGNSIASVVRRLCLATCVYLVWQERNNILFGDIKEVWMTCSRYFVIF